MQRLLICLRWEEGRCKGFIKASSLSLPLSLSLSLSLTHSLSPSIIKVKYAKLTTLF